MSNKILVLYHANCMDGFGAAFAAWLNFEDEADYVPVKYGDTPPDVTDKQVYILDFSYDRDTLLAMRNVAHSVFIIDHHKTAEKELSGLPDCIFDMNKSGAVLTWEYFHPDEEVPLLLRYIQDRDLWQWKLPNSKEFSAGLQIEPQTFLNFEWLRHATNEIIKNGEAILRYENMQIDRILHDNRVHLINIDGWMVPSINTTMYISEIGHRLCAGFPFAVMYFFTDTHKIVSLRSGDDGIDVSEIAKKFGGGGHYHAAGYRELL